MFYVSDMRSGWWRCWDRRGQRCLYGWILLPGMSFCVFYSVWLWKQWCALFWMCVTVVFVHFKWPLFTCFRLKTSGTALIRSTRMWPKWRKFTLLFFLHQHLTRVRDVHIVGCLTQFCIVFHCLVVTGETDSEVYWTWVIYCSNGVI